MGIELITIGINGAAAALVAGCVALLRLTVRNFQDSNTSTPSPEGAGALRGLNKARDHGANLEYSFSEFRSVSGNVSLLRQLQLSSELEPSLLVEGDRLSSTAANIGFSNLELVARALMNEHPSTIPYFFGINRGGGLIANLLSQRLKLDQKFLIRCDYKPKWKRVLCEPRNGVKLAIIVDDAVRTGETIMAVKAKLAEVYPEARLFVMALVVSGAETETFPTREQRLFSLLDYYPWVSMSRRTTLPWTGEESEEAADFIDEDGIDQLVGRLLSHNASTEAGPDRPHRVG